MALFDINRPTKAPIEKIGASEAHYKKYLAKHLAIVSDLQQKGFRLPAEEEFIFLQTDKSFNAFDFVLQVCEYETISHLYVSTFGLSARVAQSLLELHRSGKIEQITLFVSDTIIKRNAKVFELLKSETMRMPNFKVLYAWNHSKITLMQTRNNYYCAEGSGNFSDNAHYEQYVFANDKGLFEFRKLLFIEGNVKCYE